MCGPIAMSIPLDRSSNTSIFFGALQYNLGRVITYFVLGIIIGSIGLSIHAIGILQWISILAGVGLILFAWRKYLGKALFGRVPDFKFQRFIGGGFRKVLNSNWPLKLLLIGGINGLLPCGMVYVALLNAMLTGDIIMSGTAMAGFGIGTLPGLMIVAFMANMVGSNTRQRLNKVVPYLLSVVGLLIVLRGMNLDIPYISPKISVSQQTTEEPTNIEVSCCHSQDDCE
jgi:sulfite exporter TauE/SafE